MSVTSLEMKLQVVLVALLGLTLAKVHKHPLKRVENRNVGLVGAHGNEPLVQALDAVYTVEVDIGTPAQKFNLLLDTASANLWVYDMKCNAPVCNSKPKFNSARSSSYVNKTQSFHYDVCVGYLGQDRVCLGPSGLCFQQQIFGQATNVTIDAHFFSVIDGMLGLAWPSIAIDHVTPVFQNIMNQLDQPIFTVWMTQRNVSQAAGQITYGAYDNVNCNMTSNGGGVNWVPLSSRSYWQFSLQSVQAGSFHMSQTWDAIIDTGTDFIVVPQNVYMGLGQALNGTFDNQNNIFLVNCTAKPPPIIFTINKQTYRIPYSSYILNNGKGTCYLAIYQLQNRPGWILGASFIRQFCNVFNFGQGQIGFAKALH